jgi:NAD(P)-dependent dehydrogenase (short-subunit alcohol dehydrogenase family)
VSFAPGGRLDLSGKVALVTGGARRVGRAIAEALASDGAQVAIHYNASEREARELAEELRDRGCAEPATFRADLRDPAQAEELPGRVVERFGRLDILINSAAVMLRQPFGTVTAEMWDSVLDLNLRAYFLVAQAAAPSLRRAGGKIVNISDVAAYEPWPAYLPHSISKAGVEMLTRGLARILAPEVTVNAVAPGPVLPEEGSSGEELERLVRTIPLGRLGDPKDVTEAIRFFLSCDFVTGTTVVVDGGQLVRARSYVK